MLFLNSRTRITAVSAISMHDRSYSQKLGQTFIILGCLSIVAGLILIIIGVISEVKNTKFVGIGIISLGAGLFVTTLVCFYGKLDTCYNNWAYRSRVIPANIEIPRPPPTAAVSISPFVRSPATPHKQQSTIPLETTAPMTVVSGVEIHKVVISPSINIGTITDTSDNVT